MKTVNDIDEAMATVEEGEVVIVENQSWFKAHKKELIIGACVLGAAALGVTVYEINKNRNDQLYLEDGSNDYSGTGNTSQESTSDIF